jgi:hypothetical protein
MVSSLRFSTVPVIVTTDSSRVASTAAKVGSEESTTHWVSP